MIGGKGLLATCSVCFFLTLPAVHSDLSYSVPEEIRINYVIGNVAKDLGLDIGTISSRKARLDFEDKQFCDINLATGDLFTSERIDREALCDKATCTLKADLIMENPFELHRVSLNVQDVNDNSPTFKNNLIEMEIQESTEKGSRFSLEEAHDADMGLNAVQRYILQKNENFILSPDQNKVVLLLENKLDREKQKNMNLTLTAYDGGSPQRSGTVVIHIIVLDANDNAPVFSQTLFQVILRTPSLQYHCIQYTHCAQICQQRRPCLVVLKLIISFWNNTGSFHCLRIHGVEIAHNVV
uniref:Cadherin domain-containing protein n=1 Tax=Periophthalmus magnuspinnatus TaxID=409849 RepID=A0A3B3ZH69_9GOBI